MAGFSDTPFHECMVLVVVPWGVVKKPESYKG